MIGSRTRHDVDASGEGTGRGPGGKLAAVYSSPLGRILRHQNRKAWAASLVMIVVVLAGAFIVEAVNYNKTVLSSSACPAPRSMNTVLGTELDNVSGLQLDDLHSCHYSEGANTKALWIDAALPTGSGKVAVDAPCRHRHHFTVAGHQACSVSGSHDTTPGRPSLYVETDDVDWQITTNLSSVSMTQLETLATSLIHSKHPLFT